MANTLDQYQRQRRQTENQIRERTSKNEALKREIDRLQKAYDQMGNIKKNNDVNASLVKSRAKGSYVAGNVAWRGQSKKEFDNIMKDQVEKEAKKFYKSIDDMQDEIGSALSRKKGEFNTGNSILNGLVKTWNYVNGVIRNWTN